MLRPFFPAAIASALLGCAPTPTTAPVSPVTPSPDDADNGGPAEQPASAEAAPTADSPIAPDAVAAVGQPAPDFNLTDLEGHPQRLSDYRGKIVVLEWFNPQCPFVKFAHTEGPLRDMAKTQTEAGLVWLAINSGGAGKQGHGAVANQKGAQTYGMTHPILLDESGAVGHAYGAVKTPHVYLIDEGGTLVYRGGIDNAPFGEVDGDAPYVNHLATAVELHRTGAPIATPETSAYGCTVKYGS